MADDNNSPLFEHFDLDQVHAFMKDELGIEDPKKFQEDLRKFGGLGPDSHCIWHDILSSMGWEPMHFQESNRRLSPCFSVFSHRYNCQVPVLVENYNYRPFDSEDSLAKEARNRLQGLPARVSMVLFRSVYFKLHNGDYYCFGGYICIEGRIIPFAISQTMKSFDDMLKQVDAGFTFENPLPQFKDYERGLAVIFARMAAGLDPNEDGMGMSLGLDKTDWKFVVCDEVMIDAVEKLEEIKKEIRARNSKLH